MLSDLVARALVSIIRSVLRGRPTGAGDPHSESALDRALRTYAKAVHGGRFVLWLLVCEASFAGAATFYSNVGNHSAGAQAAMTFGGVIVAAAVAFGSTFLLTWGHAPTVQRDEARAALLFSESPPAVVDTRAELRSLLKQGKEIYTCREAFEESLDGRPTLEQRKTDTCGVAPWREAVDAILRRYLPESETEFYRYKSTSPDGTTHWWWIDTDDYSTYAISVQLGCLGTIIKELP
jgi:hypothetical protein